ncbi:MAG: methylmalonyl Co-A mutase-associated GTPase MeaB [Hyphomicrobiales bacterium]|nr:methylmalonyl Co-A mutase-associated GTPase MeaB [Hyphomicrobiales bacterium]
MARDEVEAYAAGVLSGDRAALGRAITLIESRRPEHRRTAVALLQALTPHTGRAHRIGVTGAPGAGKSTTIDQLGVNLTARGHKLAVLAVDPSSNRSGGSILGDKTRMARLAVDERAYIRPSPAAGTLGGVTQTARETIALFEAAGYDVIIVETVGVGQSEVAVAEMVDFFLVLMLPGGGDDLQGIKKGLLELADMIAVNKADGDNEGRARQTANDYRAALHILTPASPNWRPPVVMISGLRNIGLDALWEQVLAHRAALEAAGEFAAKRRAQGVRWMHAMIEERMRAALRAEPRAAARLAELEREVREGRAMPVAAAEEIIALMGLSG